MLKRLNSRSVLAWLTSDLSSLKASRRLLYTISLLLVRAPSTAAM